MARRTEPEAVAVIRLRPASYRRVRCATCRARSWRTAGDNSDTLGVVVVGDGGMYWAPAPGGRGKGRRWGVFPSYFTEILDHPAAAAMLTTLRGLGELDRLTDGLRVKCRHGHDLRVSHDRLHQLATAGTVDTIHI